MPDSFLPVAGETGVFVITLLVFLQRKADRQVRAALLLLGSSFLLLAYINLLSSLGGMYFITEARAFQALAWSSLMVLAAARITGIKKLNYILLLTVNSFLFVFVTPLWPAIIAAMSYYMAGLAFFLLFILKEGREKSAGFLGFLSAIAGILLLFVGGLSVSSPLWIVPDILLIASLSYFARFGVGIENIPSKIKMESLETGSKGGEFWKPLGYILVYTFLLNISVFIAGTGLHELGHLAVGRLLGCEGGKAVLLDLLLPSPGPYTELSCNFTAHRTFLALSGFTFIVPFGIVFLLLRRFPERHFGIVTFGLASILAGIDLQMVSSNAIVPLLSTLGGALLILVGEISFINDNIKPPE
jgi:hypothetical protein